MFEKSFIDACLYGDAVLDDIDNYTEYWHTHNTGNELHEFLGMTSFEYGEWLKSGEDVALRNILVARKNGISYEEYIKIPGDAAKLFDAMEAASYTYYTVESSEGHRKFGGGPGRRFSIMSFESFDEAAEWLDNAAFDDPEISNKVERILHPERFDDIRDEDVTAEQAPDRQRLFVDMDGTIAVFTPVDQLEKLYEKGWFEDAQPMDNVLQAVKQVIRGNPNIEVNILSAYLSDSKFALDEKNRWLDKNLPEVDAAHRVFVPCGSNKKDYIPGGLRNSDLLLDDYTKNLTLWQPPARGIKILNGINHTHGTWKYDKIRFDKPSTEIANNIASIMHGGERVLDVARPQASRAGIVGVVSWANGEKKAFTDSKEYIAEIKEEIDYSATSGFKFKTIARDAETRKAVDDIVYGLYGDENPNGLEYYRQLEAEYPENDLERMFSTLCNDRGIEAEIVKEAYNQGQISDSLRDDPKDFRLYGRDDVTSVAVFSNPAEALSHASISKLMENDFESIDRIAPYGNVFAYLKKHLDDNPGIKNVMLCTNEDQAEKLKDKLLEAGYTPEKGYHCERHTPEPTGCKSYNEYLLSCRAAQEGQRTADQEKEASARQEEDGFFPEAEPERECEP